MYGTVYMYIYNLKGPKVIQQNLFPIDSNAFSCNLQGGQHAFFYEPRHNIKENLLFCIYNGLAPLMRNTVITNKRWFISFNGTTPNM